MFSLNNRFNFRNVEIIATKQKETVKVIILKSALFYLALSFGFLRCKNIFQLYFPARSLCSVCKG